MTIRVPSLKRLLPRFRSIAGWRGVLLLLALLVNGCAAVTNPVANGVPVRRLPPELLGESREVGESLPLNLLRQSPPEVYKLEPGDVLGVYIEGVLGDRSQLPPVRLVESSGLPPAMGYPVPVRENGTVSLPFVEPVRVQGLSIFEAESLVRRAYTVDKEIIKPGRERIIVTLLQPRTSSVLVVRQDGASGAGSTVPVTFGGFVGTSEVIGGRKRGTGVNLDLPAYENDVLNALTRSGGLPGLDAKNEVLIYRNTGSNSTAPRRMPASLESGEAPGADDGVNITRIPLRLPAGEEVPFRPEDIILNSGDIVFVPSRKTEVFYTGGLLTSGQYPLPRDYDLDVVSAIALVRGTLINGGQNSNNFTGQTQSVGVGFPNPSQVSVVRRTPGGGQVVIHVNLNRALQDPRERILVQPNDLIILQNTMGEALTQYFSTSLFRLDFLATILRRQDAIATTSITAP
jgi:protein involved in polysaccharide export with SLBB domain